MSVDPMEPQLVVSSKSAEQTLLWGEYVGALLGKVDVVALIGELGAGKTTLTQGIAHGAGVHAQCYITSPTFTIINEYMGRMPVYHFDFYRIDTPSEVEDLGLEEYFQKDGVALIEWAEKIVTLLPDDYVRIALEYIDQNVRKMRVQGLGVHSQELLKKHSGYARQ